MSESTPKLGAEAAYFDHLQRGVFALQVCGHCARVMFPPRDRCAHCRAPELSWQPQTGEGTVYSFTTVRATEKGVEPYNVSLVDLDAGVRMMATIAGVPADRVRIGMRVRARIEDTVGTSRLLFDVADGDDQ